MSVLVKDMEMPKNCAVCRLERDLFGRAVCFGFEDERALHKDDLPPPGSDERRPSWCPLIEQKTGKWVFGIDEETNEQDLKAWTCSVCNEKYPWQPNFCPHCGADMRGDCDV